jgi:hypothetical protein
LKIGKEDVLGLILQPQRLKSAPLSGARYLQRLGYFLRYLMSSPIWKAASSSDFTKPAIYTPNKKP